MTAEPTPHYRRWLVPSLVATGVVLLGLAASVLTLARYAPLEVGRTTTIATPLGEASIVPYGPTRLAVVQYVDQATMTYTLPLENGGPVGLTVTDIDALTRGRLMTLTGYTPVRAPGGTFAAENGQPSFAIGGGETRYVTLFLRFENCQGISPRSGTNLDTIRVSYRGFGLVPRSQEVKLPDLIRTQSPALHSRCPGVTADSRPPG